MIIFAQIPCVIYDSSLKAVNVHFKLFTCIYHSIPLRFETTPSQSFGIWWWLSSSSIQQLTHDTKFFLSLEPILFNILTHIQIKSFNLTSVHAKKIIQRHLQFYQITNWHFFSLCLHTILCMPKWDTYHCIKT